MILLTGQKYPKPIGEPLSAALSKPHTAKGLRSVSFMRKPQILEEAEGSIGR